MDRMQHRPPNAAGRSKTHTRRVIAVLVPASSIALAVLHIRLQAHTAGFGDLFVIGVAFMALVAEAISFLSGSGV